MIKVVKHPLVRKFTLSLAGKARKKYDGDKLRAMLFNAAGIYGCTELFGLWETAKMIYHLMVKPLFRRK